MSDVIMDNQVLRKYLFISLAITAVPWNTINLTKN